MNKKLVPLYVFATEMEAAPFIEAVSARQITDDPYPVFQARKTGQIGDVLISGMGMTAAAAAMHYFLLHHSPGMVVNGGAAGCLTNDFTVGDIVYITDIAVLDAGTVMDTIKLSPIRTERPDNCLTGTLLTVERPVFDTDMRMRCSRIAQLVDMEGAVIAGICEARDIPCRLIKIVSDHAEDRKMLGKNLQKVSRQLSYALVRDLLSCSLRGVPA